MSSNNGQRGPDVGALVAGVALIGLGALFLIGQLLPLDLGRYFWPFLIIVPGALLFLLALTRPGANSEGLAIAGSIVTMVGLLLLYQNSTGHWASWAYAWALVAPTSVGLGLIVYGAFKGRGGLVASGLRLAGIGGAIFLAGAVFFELVLGISGLGLGSLGWPLLLIGLGVLLLLRALLRRADLAQPPVSPSPADNTAPAPLGADPLGPLASQEPARPSPAVSSLSAGAETESAGASPAAGRESRPLSGFDRLSFRSLGQVIVTQGEREGLEIEARDDVRARIRAEVEGHTLVISGDPDWGNWLSIPFAGCGPVRYHVSMKTIAGLANAGAGSIEAPRVESESLELTLNGAGSIQIGTLQAQRLAVALNSVGSIEVAGQVATQEVALKGAGSYRAGGLASQAARVRVSGLGSATVWVREALDAEITGAGSVDYYGQPNVTQRVTGLGSVKSLGNR